MYKRLLVFILSLCLPLCAYASESEKSSVIRYEPYSYVSASDEEKVLEVIFPDVGLGDCILLRCGGQTMLIDGGTYNNGRRIELFLTQNHVEKLDYMLNTHAHGDHSGGLTSLLQRGFPVGTLLSPYSFGNSKTEHQQLVKQVKRNGVSYKQVFSGDEMSLGGATLRFGRDTTDEALKARNENSLIESVTFGSRTILLPADIGGRAQHWFAANMPDLLKCDIMKAMHHGLALFVPEMLELTSPELVVVTSSTRKGVDQFERQLQRSQIRSLYTREGEIWLVTDGNVWYAWQTEKTDSAK